MKIQDKIKKPIPLPSMTAQQEIDQKHEALGGDSGLLGIATEDMQATPDKKGYFRRYTNGVIYWTSKTRAHEVHGAILEKWSRLGFEKSVIGYPITDETGTPDGIGRFNRFQHGMIYWTPSTGANEVRGAILDKWSVMGFEKSFLGYPLTDETGTPDGVGRFNRFQNGMIYWTPSTRAKEVHGAILERWSALGFERSWLGYPTTDEVEFAQGGRASAFQHGEIYWWPDTGAIELNDVVISYTGLNCFGETDWDGGSTEDEPYAVISVVGKNEQGTFSNAFTSRIYGDVDGGESRPDLMEIYRGKPYGLLLPIQLMEHDYGDPDKFKAAIEKAVTGAVKYLDETVKNIPDFGPKLAEIVGPILNVLGPEVAEEINKLLGTGDDLLGSAVIVLTAKDMVLLASRTPNLTEKGVYFKIASPLMSGDGSSYKVYFGVEPA